LLKKAVFIYFSLLFISGCGWQPGLHPVEPVQGRIAGNSGIKVPMLAVVDREVNGSFSQTSLFWRVVWDVEKGDLLIDDGPFFEPANAQSGAHSNYSLNWDGGGRVMVTHSVADDQRPLMPFTAINTDLIMDIYTVRTPPGRNRSITCRGPDGSTCTAYTGETGFSFIYRSSRGDHWNFSVVGSDSHAPLLVKDMGDGPGILGVRLDSDGREKLFWFTIKEKKPVWSQVRVNTPAGYSFLAGTSACAVGGSIYFTVPGGRVLSFPVNTGGETVRPLPVSKLNRAIKAEFLRQPPDGKGPAHVHLGAVSGVLIAALAGKHGEAMVLAYRDGEVLGKTVINREKIKHFLGLILPRNGYASLS
jgi:hypothetical protein